MKNKINSIKIPIQIIDEKNYNYRLVREKDGLTKKSLDIKWLEFNEKGKYKADYKEIAVGRSLLMSPFNYFFTWQTTSVTEILSQSKDYIKFATENSIYELFKE